MNPDVNMIYANTVFSNVVKIWKLVEFVRNAGYYFEILTLD